MQRQPIVASDGRIARLRQQWRQCAITTIGIHVLFSPWTIPYFSPLSTIGGGAAWNHYVVGVAMAGMGIAAARSRQAWERWAELLLGVWLVNAPWALKFDQQSAFAWNSVLMGVIVCAIAMESLTRMRGARRDPA